MQEVDLLVLAHDDVLEQVLESFGPRFLPARRDHFAQRLRGFIFELDDLLQPLFRYRERVEGGDIGWRAAAERDDLFDQTACVVELSAIYFFSLVRSLNLRTAGCCATCGCCAVA